MASDPVRDGSTSWSSETHGNSSPSPLGLLDSIAAPVCLIDQDGTVQVWNHPFAVLTSGAAPGGGALLWDLLDAPGQESAVRAALEALDREETHPPFFTGHDGRLASWEIRSAPAGIPLPAPYVCTGAVAQSALLSDSPQLQQILDCLYDGVVVADLDGRFRHWNPSADRLVGLGPSEVPVESWAETYGLFHLDRGTPFGVEELPLARAMKGESVQECEMYVKNPRHPDGVFLSINASPLTDPHGTRLGGVAVFRDITQRMLSAEREEQLRTELLHVARLSMLGEMASGVAHELNQPLAAITNYAAACRNLLDQCEGCASMPSIRGWMNRIEAEAIRAGDEIRRLRGFVGKRRSHPTHLGLPELTAEVLELIEPEIRRNRIRVIQESGPGLPRVRGDAVQIQQSLLNLLRNALDALRGSDIPDRTILVSSSRAPSGGVDTVVVDSGPGVPESVRDRIFDPFVTTKPEHVGLGLPISRSIVEDYGGRLTLEPSERGATLRLWLPEAKATR